jgi:hypothetical protein
MHDVAGSASAEKTENSDTCAKVEAGLESSPHHGLMIFLPSRKAPIIFSTCLMLRRFSKSKTLTFLH